MNSDATSKFTLMQTNRSCVHALVAALASALLAACAPGGGDAGGQVDAPPIARVTAIGNKPASDGSLTVRAGADVVLSGKDSDDADDPLVRYRWSGADAATTALIDQRVLQIVDRNATTISFAAPAPVSDANLPLRLRLTVDNAKGVSATQDILVTVLPIPDPNRFLLADISEPEVALRVVAATSAATTPAADVPFRIRTTRTLTFRRRTDSSPATVTGSVALPPLPDITGSWLAGIGTDGGGNAATPAERALGAARSYKHPRFVLPVPTVNADELTKLLRGVAETDQARDNQIYPSDIDQAEITYRIALEPLAASGSPAFLVVAAGDDENPIPLKQAVASGTGIAEVTVTRAEVLNELSRRRQAVESAETARQYYAAIDPLPFKDTLEKWLKDNCFDPGATNYGDDGSAAATTVRATYTNNFDLGFGRDMYFKTGCTTAERTRTGATIRPDAGERAAVVINYPSLEAAARKTGAFLVVAMEYRRPENPAFGNRIVTSFYTFAPNPRTGAFERVLSANFDGRGERFTPGNCTVCHGGKPKTGAGNPYATSIDLGAQFIPWDLGSLLYADTDTSFTDTALRGDMLRSKQEPQLKKLNDAMLATLVDQVGDSDAVNARRKAMRDLVAGWYSAGAFNGDYVPPAWRGQRSPATPADATQTSDALYRDVFAQNCRMCHLQRIEDGVTDTTTGVRAAATAPQFSSYDDLFRTVAGNRSFLPQLARTTFSDGVMPAARLTMDRFWTSEAPGKVAAGAALAAHLGIASGDAKPGRPTADFFLPRILERGRPVRLDAFHPVSRSYAWRLAVRPDGSAAKIVGANSSEAAFLPDKEGDYQVELTVVGPTGLRTTAALQTGTVPQKLPRISAPTTPIDLTVGTPFVLELAPYITDRGDAPSQLRVGSATGPITLSSPVGSALAVDQITISPTATGSAALTITVTDGDNQAASAVVRFNIASPPPVVTVTALPKSDPVVPAPALQATPANFTSAQALTRLPAARCVDIDVSGSIIVNGTAPAGSRKYVELGAVTGGGTVSQAVLGSTTLTYCAPRRFVSGGAGEPDNPRFAFTASLVDALGTVVSANRSTTSVTVAVSSTPGARFRDVYSILSGDSCSGCHSGSAVAGENPRWRSFSGAPAAIDKERATHDSLIATDCPGAEGAGVTARCVIPGNDSSAGGASTDVDTLYLLRKPTNQGVPHTNSPRVDCSLNATTKVWSCSNPQSFDQLRTLLRWLEEGGYRN